MGGMFRRIAAPVMVVVVVGAGACGSGDSGRSAAALRYEAEQRQVQAVGREVISQLRDGDIAAVAARFSPEMAARVTPTELEGLVRELRAAGGVGPRTDEGELIQGPDSRVYQAEHQVGGGRWTFGLAFDEGDDIVGGEIRPAFEPLPPDPKAGYQPRATLRFPLEGEWFVYWGGDRDLTNYHVRAPDQRHAYDLVVWRDGGTHRGEGRDNDEYWAWGQPIHAPAAGTVVVAVDGTPDSQPAAGAVPGTHPAGNHVLLDVGEGEYLLLAHFQKDSVRVKAGDKVTEGQVLGLVGSSGNSSEPHLHVHLQDSPTPLSGRGLPLPFSDLIVDGHQTDKAPLEQGQFVRAD